MKETIGTIVLFVLIIGLIGFLTNLDGKREIACFEMTGRFEYKQANGNLYCWNGERYISHE